LVDSWSTFYEHNYFDQAPIISNHPYHRNFAMAAGTCGLGAQHGPAIGKALMENFIYDDYRTMDLSRFTFDRILDDEPLNERLMF
jgi:FAD-dependent oxidoreductase domain-containing protein 1